jgi:hypothetical protein
VIAAIISAVGGFIRLLIDWMDRAREKMLISLGASQQKTSDLQGRLDALNKANKLKQDAIADIKRNPGSLMSDDGFQRPEGDD